MCVILHGKEETPSVAKVFSLFSSTTESRPVVDI